MSRNNYGMNGYSYLILYRYKVLRLSWMLGTSWLMEGKVLHIVKNGYVILYWLKPSGTYEQICAVQSYSVTGALNLASNFLARFPPTANGRAIYVPNPTLPEDLVSLKASGMEIRQFRFLDQRLGGIDWEGLREDLMVSTILTTEGFWLT
jgi:hypothetical protein